MSEVKPVSEAIKTLAKAIAADLTVNEDGTVKAPDDLFAKHLPEGLDLATVKKVHTQRQEFMAASALAVGEVGIEAMKANKNLDQVQLKVNVGKDVATVTTVRRHEQAVPGSQDTVVSHGYTTASYKAKGGSVLKTVRDHLKTVGAASLCD